MGTYSTIEVSLHVTEKRTDCSVNGVGTIEFIWEAMKLGHYLTHKLNTRRIKVLPLKGKAIMLSEDMIEENLHNLR